jgi:hypothetical protein
MSGATCVFDDGEIAILERARNRVIAEQIVERGVGTARRAHSVVVAGEQGQVGMMGSLLREGGEISELVRDVRPGKARARRLMCDGIM